MPFTQGQTIVHPFHGPARVTRIKQRKVRGVPTRYIDLTTIERELSISVPLDSIDEVGLRPVVSRERVEELLEMLRTPSGQTPANWSRRMKDYRDRIATGDIDQLAHVVREITVSGPKTPGSAEGALLRDAREALAAEFAVALDVDTEAAEGLIDEATAHAAEVAAA